MDYNKIFEYNCFHPTEITKYVNGDHTSPQYY